MKRHITILAGASALALPVLLAAPAQASHYDLEVTGQPGGPGMFEIPGANVGMINIQDMLGKAFGGRGVKREIKVAAGDIVSLPVQLSVAPEKLPSTTNEITFTLKSADDSDAQVEAKSRFIGPQIR